MKLVMLLVWVRDAGLGAVKSLVKQQDLMGYKKSTSI